MVYLYVFIGGGLGSLARFGTGKLIQKFVSTEFPLGTLIANILACAILAFALIGLFGQLEKNTWIQPLILIGFCGGFSTFSTFSNETLDLFTQGNYGYAILNMLISLAAGIALIWLIRSRV